MTNIYFLSAATLIALLGTLHLLRYSRSHYATLFHTLLFLLFVAYQLFYLASHYFTGDGITPAVFYHLHYGLKGAGFGAYSNLILQLSAALLATFLLTYLLGRSMTSRVVSGQKGKVSRKFAYLLVLTAFVISPTSYGLYHIYQEQTRQSSPPRLLFSELYSVDEIKPVTGKKNNLLFIYAESLERTYLDEELFPGLLPGIRQLEKEATTFTHIEQAPNTGWTIAGITASQCGIPLVSQFTEHSMQHASYFLPGAHCLGDSLAEAGYTLSSINGSALEFSGLGKFFRSHGFSRVRGGPGDLVESMNDSDYTHAWGLYDDTLFDFALDELAELSDKEEPFALYLTTMDTHHPEGHISRTCGDLKYGDGSNPMLNAVACSDRLISQFITHIRGSDYGENLVIVVVSDHLAMGAGNTAINSLRRSDQRRNLFMVLSPDKQAEVVNNKGSMLDVGPTLLPFIGFSGNLGLGRDLLSRKSLFEQHADFHDLLIAWKQDLMKLWELSATVSEDATVKDQRALEPVPKKVNDAIDVTAQPEFSEDRNRFIAHAGGAIDGKQYTNSLEALNQSYAKGFRLFELDIIKTRDGIHVAAHDWPHWRKITGFYGTMAPTHQEFMSQKIYDKYTPLDIEMINHWFSQHDDAFLITDKVNTPSIFADLFIDNKRLIMELFSTTAVIEATEIGDLRPMPNMDLLRGDNSLSVSQLKEMGITHVATSRRAIEGNNEMFDELKRNNIKVYVYSVNHDQGKDEAYVICNENQYIYGLYADNYDFGNPVRCE